MNKYAIIVVDMLNDFVYGKLKCDNAKTIIQPNKALIAWAHQKGVPVIFANDAHIKGIDHELKLWGNHAIKGEEGANVINELKPTNNDYIIEKRRYSGFFGTSLQLLLTELGVNTVIITGLHTHMCCRHTAADAYQYGYQVIIASDATTSFTNQDYISGLEYLKTVYGAKIMKVAEIKSLS